MRLPASLELIADHEGFGKLAERGDRVTYNVRIFLNRGDEVPLNETQAQAGLPQHTLRLEGSRVLIDHKTVLGQREGIAGIESALLGMKPGGLIPPNAVLTVEIWMRDVRRGT